MDFSHYKDGPAGFAVDVVNTDEVGGDEIEDLERLEEFLTRFEQLRPPGLAPATDADLLAIRRIRDTLRQVFNAEDEPTATDRLDSILDEHPALARIVTHGDHPHLHYEPLEATVASWVGATTAMGLAGIMVEHGISRFGSCAAGNCRDVFVDTTRNRSRIHCCQACSTREAVAAYRRRNQGG